MRKAVILAAGLLSFGPPVACAVGPFVEVSRTAFFVGARREPSLAGSITRASSQGRGAAVFALGASFPVRSTFLARLEISYVTLDLEDGVEDGFGDATLRLKARAWGGGAKTLFFMSSLRLGSGSTTLFPYSTASTDVEIGMAFVDSLGAREGDNSLRPLHSLSYWVAAGGVYVVRIDDRLKEAEMHGSHATAGGGILLAVTRKVDLEVGGLGLFFDSGAVREVYFSQVSVALSPAMVASVSVQGERGDWRERAVDASATAAVTVTF